MNENKPTLPFHVILFSILIVLILGSLLGKIVFGETETIQIMPTIVKWEHYEWTWEDEVLKVVSEPLKDTRIETLHAKICKRTSKSPLCEDIEILRRIDTIAKEKWVPTWLIIWIMHSESTLATHYNKPACSSYNNPYWIKWRKYDTGKVEWYTKSKGKPDNNGCWLYKFNSIDEATYSLANTISIGYASCNNDVTCLSYKYVGNPDIAEQSWIDRVSQFL